MVLKKFCTPCKKSAVFSMEDIDSKYNEILFKITISTKNISTKMVKDARNNFTRDLLTISHA